MGAKSKTRSAACKKSWTAQRRRVWAVYMREKKTTHGMSRTVEHNTWCRIKDRCYNRNNADYADYGGRGIKVYAPWRRSFEMFFKAMGPRPKGTSIDRIDNSKGYVPDNVRWATPRQQGQNRRNVVLVTFRGRTQPLPDWARELGIRYDTLRYRLHKLTAEEAFTQPLRPGRAWKGG